MTRSLIGLLVLLTALFTYAQPPRTQPARPTPSLPSLPSLALPPATGEQLAAAAMTYLGGYVCESDQRLQVSPNSRSDGYLDLRFGKQLHTMKPVLSSTGVLRLEDIRGRLLLLQIATKSMLLDGRTGLRVVDECVHEKQTENRRAMATEPTQSGLGIEPVQATATPASVPATAAPAASAPEAPASAVH